MFLCCSPLILIQYVYEIYTAYLFLHNASGVENHVQCEWSVGLEVSQWDRDTVGIRASVCL